MRIVRTLLCKIYSYSSPMVGSRLRSEQLVGSNPLRHEHLFVREKASLSRLLPPPIRQRKKVSTEVSIQYRGELPVKSNSMKSPSAPIGIVVTGL